MFTAEVIEHCAPTLAGIKTGNIFTVKKGICDISAEIRNLNRILVKKGLRMVPIKNDSKYTLIYLYRPKRLKRDLCQKEAVDILSGKGYRTDSSEFALVQLVKHLASDEEFPHEIGLFLGYPPSDVKAFMKSPCDGVKCCGCWKAYSNECEAKEIFERYKKCSRIYRFQIKNGKTLESLIVEERDYRVAV